MNPVYRALGIGLAALGVLSLSVLGISKAYTSIYQRGYKAGELAEHSRRTDLLLKAQDRQLALQQQITKAGADYAALQAQFTALETQSPKEVVRHVRSDPAFAAARRPAGLHEQRVRELRALQAAAAAH